MDIRLDQNGDPVLVEVAFMQWKHSVTGEPQSSFVDIAMEGTFAAMVGFTEWTSEYLTREESDKRFEEAKNEPK